MKKTTWLLLPALLLISLALLPTAAIASDPAACPENLISVTGSGEILTTPDIGLATLNCF